ncbi:hypothetical protein BSL78_05216 [Apostichopus japonicus]|uniref:Uncharacterized protein n=1 Tax=Stichopus japonicus TaxID=307972 RepID=A0A2G8LC51_STIJA|nr:hypothetical protein BSL78_05216 [Apostichopus japonicus]
MSLLKVILLVLAFTTVTTLASPSNLKDASEADFLSELFKRDDGFDEKALIPEDRGYWKDLDNYVKAHKTRGISDDQGLPDALSERLAELSLDDDFGSKVFDMVARDLKMKGLQYEGEDLPDRFEDLTPLQRRRWRFSWRMAFRIVGKILRALLPLIIRVLG